MEAAKGSISGQVFVRLESGDVKKLAATSVGLVMIMSRFKKKYNDLWGKYSKEILGGTLLNFDFRKIHIIWIEGFFYSLSLFF